MDSQDSSLDKEYERLNDAIMKAIVSSKDVEKVLQDFNGKKMINDLAVLNLILSLEELYDLVFSNPETQSEFSLEPMEGSSSMDEPEPKQTPTKPGCIVDGENLTPNEILFEKYLQRNFDEKDWLRKVGIKL